MFPHHGSSKLLFFRTERRIDVFGASLCNTPPIYRFPAFTVIPVSAVTFVPQVAVVALKGSPPFFDPWALCYSSSGFFWSTWWFFFWRHGIINKYRSTSGSVGPSLYRPESDSFLHSSDPQSSLPSSNAPVISRATMYSLFSSHLPDRGLVGCRRNFYRDVRTRDDPILPLGPLLRQPSLPAQMPTKVSVRSLQGAIFPL